MDKPLTHNKARQGFIGSSDAKRIIDGDWLALWEEKTGRRKAENLDHVFRVQLGIATEGFHALWLGYHYEGMENTSPPKVSGNKKFPWLRATCDRWLIKHDTFLELKHSNERQTMWSATEYYMPQIGHQCIATHRRHGYLSFIPGNLDPVVCKVAPTEEFLLQLLELEKAFWWHVEADSPPDKLPGETLSKAEAGTKQGVINDMRRLDMSQSNSWVDAAKRYLENKPAATAHEKAKKDLKELIEKDVVEAAGAGITIRRDKKGSLRFVGGDDE